MNARGLEMGDDLIRLAVPAAFGAAYGGVLGMLGFIAAGVGHGSYVPLGLASSPLGLTGNVAVALFVLPVLWGGVGLLLGLSRRSWPFRCCFLAAMLAHYAALPAILSDAGHFGDWEYVPKVRDIYHICVAVYAAGQIGIWVTFALGLLWRDATGSGESRGRAKDRRTP